MKVVMDSLTKLQISFEVFSDVGVEPTDESLQRAIKFCQERFVAYPTI